ncbi:MAG: dUTP diphosphatase [Deltaproteobacteria bacterium]
MNSANIKIKVLNDKILEWGLPKYATEGSAGLDLCACIDEPVTINPGERILINTGAAIHIEDKNLAGFIFARSGLASKKGIALSNGVGLIDSDYINELKVALVNIGLESQVINPGDRIAQLVIMPIVNVCWTQVEDLDVTTRFGGFGSTGVNSRGETSVRPV